MLDALGPLFHDPCWDILLDLYVAGTSTRNGSRRAVPVSAPRRP